MIKQIITYPTPPSLQYSAPVRSYSSEVSEIIQDLKDTLVANSLEGLAAFQIANPLNIVVIKKEDDSFLVLLNPKIIMMQGKLRTEEKTAYFPGLSADVNRYEKVSVVYEDKEMKSQVLKADGEFAILLQRKIDYTFGSSFINKLDPQELDLFRQKLEHGSDFAQIQTCPTTFKRDYISKLINIILILMVFILAVSFFTSPDLDIWSYQKDLALITLGLNVVYFFYSLYEAKSYVSCSSCQIGNIIGVVAISLLRISTITLLSYFLI